MKNIFVGSHIEASFFMITYWIIIFQDHILSIIRDVLKRNACWRNFALKKTLPKWGSGIFTQLTTFEPEYIESLSNIGFKMFMMGQNQAIRLIYTSKMSPRKEIENKKCENGVILDGFHHLKLKKILKISIFVCCFFSA